MEPLLCFYILCRTGRGSLHWLTGCWPNHSCRRQSSRSGNEPIRSCSVRSPSRPPSQTPALPSRRRSRTRTPTSRPTCDERKRLSHPVKVVLLLLKTVRRVRKTRRLAFRASAAALWGDARVDLRADWLCRSGWLRGRWSNWFLSITC